MTAGRLKDAPSLARFSRAATRAARFHPATSQQDLEYAFETLEQVRQGGATVWQIVYDVSARQIHYRTRSSPRLRLVDLKALDFSCARPVEFLDIQTGPSPTGRPEFRAARVPGVSAPLESA